MSFSLTKSCWYVIIVIIREAPIHSSYYGVLLHFIRSCNS
uniref:Uncharacterized protein n=2 Tax=unclassified Caudoviricetes TaxID=2788787 RepID=A0A8S5PHJ9_9CAUD|nr:MAG TPA: hypothetical protein [Siphoviridae sp. ctJcm18]DAE06671.1 MAG TPA: hypothetical protein [Siphoviridae sp. ctUGQ45]